MTRYFMRDTPLCQMEQQMMTPPYFKPRGHGRYYPSFKYSRDDMECPYHRFLTQFTSCFQSLKGFLADYMLNPAGIPLGSNRIDASCHKHLCKKAMLFVGILGNLTAEIRQVQEVISIHEQETALFQCSHRMAHTGFGDLQVSGHIRRPHHALFLLEDKDGLQIVLPGRMKSHGSPQLPLEFQVWGVVTSHMTGIFPASPPQWAEQPLQSWPQAQMRRRYPVRSRNSICRLTSCGVASRASARSSTE